MGCVHGKCCCRYPRSTDGDNREDLGRYAQVQTHILAGRSVESAQVPSHNFRLEYSVLTQRGFYPESPEKENQDSYCIRTQLQGNPNVHFFGVFDGHGQFGTECSLFVRDRLVEILSNDSTLLDDPVKAYNSAFLITNEELHNSDIDDSMSGTTAITALLVGDMLYVANVGDSRAVMAVKEGNRVVAKDLSSDQTPFRKDECERVKSCGARVLSVDQVEGLKDPDIQSWGDEETEGGDPPRLWVQNGMYPGTAFTRSVGDSTAESIGVVAVPEVTTVHLTAHHPFFVVASDGVFEFLSSQTVVDMVNRCADPRDASSAIAGESYKLWLDHENRTDDITIIIVHIKALSNSGGGATAKRNGERTTNTQKETSEIFFTPCASEGYRSVRSELSEVSCCQTVASSDQSSRVVVSSSLWVSLFAKTGAQGLNKEKTSKGFHAFPHILDVPETIAGPEQHSFSS